jgi:nucleotide-binding universal stress UspA family protein
MCVNAACRFRARIGRRGDALSVERSAMAREGDPMIKTILVPSTGSELDDAVFATALAVARRFAAHLDFLHVRLDAAALAVAMTSDGGGATILGGLTEGLEEEADRREAAAKKGFDEFCRREGLAVRDAPSAEAGPSAAWRCEVGLEPAWVTEHGRAADLIVAGRPGDEEGLVSETIETALLDCGRPLLIPGGAPMTAIPDTIVIAWKPTREAAHAVTVAMPFLAAAKEIVVLTVAEDEAVASAEGGPLMNGLRWHGFQVSAHHLPPGEAGAADTMLGAVRERNALLVMGGYGHSRLRQWIFGGFTRRVLSAAEVPVLIAH